MIPGVTTIMMTIYSSVIDYKF